MIPPEKREIEKRIALIACGVGLMAFFLRRGNRQLGDIESSSTADRMTEAYVAVEDITMENDRRPRRWPHWLKLPLCLGATGLSIFLYLSQHRIAASISLLIAAALSTIFARTPKRRRDLWFLGILFILATGQAAAIITIAGISVASTISPTTLIQSVAFGFAGACVAGVVSAKWLALTRIAEPAALGLTSVLLILVCIPGLVNLIQPLNIPTNSGSATLFVSNPGGQNVTLSVEADEVFVPPTVEIFDISTTSRQRLRWVLVVSGPAQMTNVSITGRVSSYTITDPYDPQYNFSASKVQLFSGYANSASDARVGGKTVGSFTAFSSDRSAVTLPDYGIWPFGSVSPAVMGMVHRLLGANPATPSHAKVNVNSGPLDLADTLTGSMPPPLSSSGTYGELEWSSAFGNPISYTVSNQNLSGLDSTALFLLAFLLGVAGAGLFASLQTGIHIYVSDRSNQS